jgi:hypothetical protein
MSSYEPFFSEKQFSPTPAVTCSTDMPEKLPMLHGAVCHKTVTDENIFICIRFYLVNFFVCWQLLSLDKQLNK